MPVIIFITAFPWKTGNTTFQLKAKQFINFWGVDKASPFWVKMAEGTQQQGTDPNPTCLHKNKLKMDSNAANSVLKQ